MVLFLSEIEEYFNKANNKLIASKGLYEMGQYSTAVSTCYYAMFLTAKALLIKKGVKFGKTHNGLIHAFNNHIVHQDNFPLEVYRYFASTQSLREEADYDAFDGITQNIAKEKIKQAEKFIKESEKFI